MRNNCVLESLTISALQRTPNVATGGMCWQVLGGHESIYHLLHCIFKSSQDNHRKVENPDRFEKHNQDAIHGSQIQCPFQSLLSIVLAAVTGHVGLI